MGDRWTLLIASELLDGPLRFKQLQERIPGVTHATLDHHLRVMLANGLVRRRASELRPRIEYELSQCGHDLLCVLRELSCWAMRRVWSAPRPDEHVEPGTLMRHLPLLVGSTNLPNGVVELVIEHNERPERHMVNLDRGRISMLRLNSGSVMPWARIEGSHSAWIDTFGPLGSSERLRVSGDASLAGALLDALTDRP
ncbi:MAG: winged helix-turn-helix transcriptional regulator [Solirubrobacteraceae bacterium]